MDDLYRHPSYPLLIVISGPSGVGKDTVIGRMKERGLPFHFVVTATTRAPRPGEVNGQDYLFYSAKEFAHLLEKGEFLEAARVYNDYKGIPKQQVRQALASGQDVVLRVDVQGAQTVRRLCPDALLIFLFPASEEDLARRLQERHTESPEGLSLRLATAREEIGRLGEFDYVVPNRDHRLDETVDLILGIIQAEHARVHPRQVTL
ncbi:MAG: guanylate kinase [Anaerolineales bacterium]